MDQFGAFCGLVFLSPLFAAIALAHQALRARPGVLPPDARRARTASRSRSSSSAPWSRTRTTRWRELQERNEAGDGLFKITDDPRVTTIGKWLRRSSLDELPQLINVMRGEMSLVGPRPLIPEQDKQIEGKHRRRLHLKPGMTGQWQIFGSSRIPMREMVTIDYLYVANWSLWGDIKILCRTVPYMLARRGL